MAAKVFEDLKAWAGRVKRDILALWLASRDLRTPIGPKVVAGIVAAYALSPVDLIPDFIPVLGYLDDVILVPLGIALAVRMIPLPLMDEFRKSANALAKPRSAVAFIAIVGIWLIVAALICRAVMSQS